MDIYTLSMRIAGLSAVTVDFPTEYVDPDLKKMTVEFQIPYKLHKSRIRQAPDIDLRYKDGQAETRTVQNKIDEAVKKGKNKAQYVMETAPEAGDTELFSIYINIPYIIKNGRAFIMDWDETEFQEIVMREFNKKNH